MPATKNIIVNLPGLIEYHTEGEYTDSRDGTILMINCELPDSEGSYLLNLEIIDPVTGDKLAPVDSENDVIIEDGKVKMYLFPIIS